MEAYGLARYEDSKQVTLVKRFLEQVHDLHGWLSLGGSPRGQGTADEERNGLGMITVELDPVVVALAGPSSVRS